MRLGVDCTTRKKALQILAGLLADGDDEFAADKIFKCLLEREKLGSTGLGRGVAIPHCRLAGMGAPRTALLRLNEAVDFDAPDGEGVLLFCALVLDEDACEEHLQLLSKLAATLNDDERFQLLRTTTSPEEVAALLRAPSA